ncbi:MAG: alpha/beta fold hydrolase [Chitinophagales bacterium]|nr:alpha/beta fold hydrolase [Chitinophagales bacterium]
MKLFLLPLLLLIISTTTFCQKNLSTYKCDCNEIGLDVVWADTNKVSCYLIPVERNYIDPRGEKYFIAVATAPALSATPKEPLLYLHGGPGIATLSNFPRYLKSKTFSKLRQDHSLVFFDYRGTGFSEPVLCKSLDESLRDISDTISAEEQILKETILYANCKETMLKQGILLSDFSSLQSASDAETIRKELGINDWNIYSVSHGTTVALHMMRSFPQHIKSVILDSPFPPNAPWLDFVQPFDTCFKVLEKSIKEDSLYNHLFPSIKNDFLTITNRLQYYPLQIPLFDSIGNIIKTNYFDDEDFVWSVWTAMLDPYTITLIPLALQEIANGNDSVLLEWAMVFNDPNSFGEFSSAQSRAILGYETKPRHPKETENYIIKTFPDFASFITPGLDSAINKVYRPEIPPKEYFDAVNSNIPTLIFAGEYDPVCPPLFANITAETLSNSTVIIVPNASHASMFIDDCTRTIAATFYFDPEMKVNVDCVMQRKKMEFVREDIMGELK